MVSAPATRPDRMVCKCLAVTEREIARVISAGARSVTEIGAGCEAGTGCTGCHDALVVLLGAAARRRTRAAARRGTAQLRLFGDVRSHRGVATRAGPGLGDP